ncbi:MAG: hypothetical protein RLZZ26_679 [Candidatus Parcubacteria bacterium]
MGPASRQPMNLSNTPRATFPYITLIAVAVIVVISIATLLYFSKAEVDVAPSNVSAAIQSSFSASQAAGGLPYQIITAQKIASQAVKGSGTKTVNSSASGSITIYNTQSKLQTLVANTRFATAAGLIFRIHASVSVPAGSATKPGSATAKIVADKEGSSYNVAPTNFTVPGFAGTPQASQVYARSASPTTGGASGAVPVVDSALETQTRTALQAALEPDLLSSVQSQIPSGYVLVPGASLTTYQAVDSAPSSVTGQVDVKEQGTVTAIVFPNTALAKTIAKIIPTLGYNDEPITLASTNQLLLATAAMPATDTDTFTFTLAGTAQLAYGIDSSKIAAAVAGKSRQAAQVAVSNFPEVNRAVIILRPFWRSTFPDDPSAIKIVPKTP